MNKFTLYSLAAVLLLAACAKTPTTPTNAASKAFFDAWVTINDDGSWVKTPLGAYIMEDEPGTGAVVEADTTANHYLWMEYVATTLKGSVSSFTFSETYRWAAEQMNAAKSYYYFGPRIWQRGENTLFAGLDDALVGMREGGRRKVALPGWLNTYARYSTPEEYYDKASGTSAIYDIKLVKIIPELHDWEADSLLNYVRRHFPGADEKTGKETGLYYIQRIPPRGDVPLSVDSTYYVHYIGRCLDGRVFDTSIRDTAMFYGIWSPSRTYGPVSIKWAEKAADFKMNGESSVITGFAGTLLQMGRYEGGTGIFISSMGYGSQGSSDGNMIPPFSPLRFDIQLCDSTD